MKKTKLFKLIGIAGISLVIASSSVATGLAASTQSKSAPASYSQQQSQISLDKAIEIALKDAGVKKSDAKITESKTDKYDRTPHYEIEFIANSKEYEYEIAMSTGKILKKEVENTSSATTKPSADTSKYISLDEAKKIALKRANVDASKATFKKAELDTDDSTAHYDIEFVSGKYKYEVEVNAKTGKVIDYEKERASKEDLATPSEDSTKYISLDEAKKIALKRARVNASKATFTKSKLGTDGKSAHYDIEFTAGNYEYEVEVNAKTGKVTDYEKDRKSAQPSSKHITAQRATDIALSHAKLDSASVIDLKVKFNKRLFVSYYEVEFECGNYEYEYKINAKSGKIISVGKEID